MGPVSVVILLSFLVIYVVYYRKSTFDDVVLLSHESEIIDTVTHSYKFLYFHENTRPAYYGTWRKKSTHLSPRNPFKQDQVSLVAYNRRHESSHDLNK